VNCRTVVCHTYKAGAAVHAKSHHFHSLTFQSFTASFHCCPTPTLRSMAEKIAHDPPTTDKPAADDTRSDSGTESAAPTTSSPTPVVIKMVNRKIPELSYFFKKTIITKDERKAYHDFGWPTDNIMSTIPEVDVPTVHGSTVVCFESHLIAGLGLPPSKFVSAIMNFLGCELAHFNPNVIIALSCFTMLCECWLKITSGISLF
jgi:hypothetical protein